ncbi:MAG: hypothetical protein QXT68_07305 [Halobacteria archaeon]
MKRVQAYPIRISLAVTGPPCWDSSRGWMVGEAKGPAMDEVLQDAARLVREAVPRLLKGWSHTDATVVDSVRVHVEVEGPPKHANSVELFRLGRATVVSKKRIEEVVRKTTSFIHAEAARMEEAWNGTIRYWKWMREQEEARRQGKRGGTPPGKSS